jgi:hypothetical protein
MDALVGNDWCDRQTPLTFLVSLPMRSTLRDSP